MMLEHARPPSKFLTIRRTTTAMRDVRELARTTIEALEVRAESARW
jgi:hypothetical protein